MMEANKAYIVNPELIANNNSDDCIQFWETFKEVS
jgi:hypothetical protein